MPGFLNLPMQVATTDARNCAWLVPPMFERPNGQVVRAKLGATTDWASTPSVCWMTLPPFGAYAPAAGIHDACYRGDLELLMPDGTWQQWLPDKPTSDLILMEGMIAMGVPDVVRLVIYNGVHFGGWSSFDADRKAFAAR